MITAISIPSCLGTSLQPLCSFQEHGDTRTRSGVKLQSLPSTSRSINSSTDSINTGHLRCEKCLRTDSWRLSALRRRGAAKHHVPGGRLSAMGGAQALAIAPDEVPYAAAIGTVILTSAALFIVPLGRKGKEPEGGDDSESELFGADDVRYTAMSVLSFIPLFNWLAWVFAWRDTQQVRYLVYALIYAAPYIKTGLQISPEESWLPIASTLLCALHVQVERSAVESEPLVRSLGLPQVKELPKPSGRSFSNFAEKVRSKGADKQEEDGEKATKEQLETAAQEAKEEMRRWDKNFTQKDEGK
eukprot:jgi/Mesen1/10937/ME000095S10270